MRQIRWNSGADGIVRMEEGERATCRETRSMVVCLRVFCFFRGLHVDFMARALELADLAVGRTSPNPAVGAVVVRDGRIVGEGYTQPPGQAHAEAMALREAGPRADGAELYVTLEPCCHFGRTPPCTEAILSARIRKVFVATRDPFPAVDGRGIEALQTAGLDVALGDREIEAVRLNRAFFHMVRQGRPFVTAKWAMTLDGKLATSRGDSKWISSSMSRQIVHQERDASDAIVVGIGTVLADDPRLTVRLDSNGPRRSARPTGPVRVVVDTFARTPITSQLLTDVEAAPVLIATTDAADPERVRSLRQAGAEVIGFPLLDHAVDLQAVLEGLGQRGINRVLLEGGSTLFGSFFESNLIDRVLAFVAPCLAGGQQALSPIGGTGIEQMSEARRLADVTYRSIGTDLLMEGYLS